MLADDHAFDGSSLFREGSAARPLTEAVHLDDNKDQCLLCGNWCEGAVVPYSAPVPLFEHTFPRVAVDKSVWHNVELVKLVYWKSLQYSCNDELVPKQMSSGDDYANSTDEIVDASPYFGVCE